jgi:DNA polymerase elongation subunit (family B)
MLRNMQKEVLIDILNGKGDSAKRKLVKLRNDIALGKFDAEEIAIPKGMSKPIGEYVKQVPPHVRGARVANVLCGENIVQEKIKYVYVKPRPGSNCKSDVISFTQQFPYDKFKVDYNRMAEKLIDNVYDTIFITMGWNIEELCGQTSLAAYM